MGDYDEPAPAGPATGRRWTVLAVLAALVVGLVAGYLLRGGTGPAAPAAAPPAAPPAPPPTTAAAPPSPCVEIARGGSDLVAQLEQAARAIGALDPTALRAVLDEVQRLRTELEADVAACRAGAGGSVAAPTPSG